MRLPRTSESRRDPGYLRLITDVDVYAPPGLQFRCAQLLTPGTDFDPGALPRPAVLLEYAGRIRIAKHRSRYAFNSLWLLWRFDFERSEWREVIRAIANDASWSIDFAPVAKRLIEEDRCDGVAERAKPLSERVTTLLGAELAEMTREVRCHVLAAIDQYIAAEIVRTVRPLTLHSFAVGGRPWYPRLGAQDGVPAGELRV